MAKKIDKTEENSIQKEININEIKAELVDYMKREIDIEIDDAVKEKERKYIRAKSRKIFMLEIIIFLLILIMIGAVIYLYKDRYFDKYFNHGNNEVVEKENNDISKNVEIEAEEEKEKIEKEEKPSLEELKKKYDNILGNIKITNKNKYLENFYNNKYSDELKLSMATALIEDSKLKEDGSYIIRREDIEMSYKKLFTSEINLVPFEYNGVSFNYIKSLQTYIGTGNIEESREITKEIIKIEESENIIKVTTKEYYLVNDNKVNPVTDKLNEEEKVYEFKNVEGNYLINE